MILRSNFQISSSPSLDWHLPIASFEPPTRFIRWGFSAPSPHVETGEATGVGDSFSMRKSKVFVCVFVCVYTCAEMGEFNSDDHYIYYCGQESLRRNGVAIMVNKTVEMRYLDAISKMTE